jgi:hypothetical protein
MEKSTQLDLVKWYSKGWENGGIGSLGGQLFNTLGSKKKKGYYGP